MARHLKTIAREINESLPGYYAEVTAERMNTDRKIGRIRYPRKGLAGNRICIYEGSRLGHCVFSYHTREYYKTNECVEQWLREAKRELEKE